MVLNELAVINSHGANHIPLSPPPGGGDFHELSLMRAGLRQPVRQPVFLPYQLVECCRRVGEGGEEVLEERPVPAEGGVGVQRHTGQDLRVLAFSTH